ncbi:MAG: hypothetical protein ACTH31_13150 [Pseudoclavibacter sp.]
MNFSEYRVDHGVEDRVLARHVVVGVHRPRAEQHHPACHLADGGERARDDGGARDDRRLRGASGRVAGATALVGIAGAGYLIDTVIVAVAPAAGVSFGAFTFVGEVALFVWLIWRGGRRGTGEQSAR